MAKKRQLTVIIRGGKGVEESTDGWLDIDGALTSDMERPGVIIEVDHDVPLKNRGLVPDCRQVFSVDYYLPRHGARFYGDLEAIVLQSKKFAKLYMKLRDRLFELYPFERDNWDNPTHPSESIRVQLVDPHGGGSLIIQGLLKFFVACIGRDYDPMNDPRDNPERHPELKKRSTGTKTVSLIADLLATLAELEPDEIGLACGSFGATGPSVAMALNELLRVLKNTGVMPVMMIALPETFLVDGNVPVEMAERLSVIVDLMKPCVLMPALGQSGIVWRVMVDHLRTWGELFSNVHAKHLAFKCASALTAVIMPAREDLEARWLMYNIALSNMSAPDATAMLKKYQAVGRVEFQPVPYERGIGVRVYVRNSRTLKIWEWQELLPALATAQRNLGKSTMLLPVTYEEPTGGKSLFGGKQTQKVTREKTIESVPLLKAIMSGIGAESVAQVADATSYWALTAVERDMLDQQKMLSFEEAFRMIGEGFTVAVEQYLLKTLFAKKIFPPTKVTYSEPCQAVAIWSQVNLSNEALPDAIFASMFAPVDRSDEERRAIEAKEEERTTDINARAMEYYANIGEPEEGGKDART